jgi:hypothetical protein
MVKAKSSKAKKKGESPANLFEVFPGLSFVINYNEIKTGTLGDNAQAFTLIAIDDAEDLEQLPDIICNRSFTYKEALRLSTALGVALKAVDALKKQYGKLDEINCYLDSMQSTVDDYRRELKEDVENLDGCLDHDGDLRDLEDLVKNF